LASLRLAVRIAACLALCPVGVPAAAAADWQCDAGYVWRDAFPGDYVCVTPEVRDRVRHDNDLATSRRAPGSLNPGACSPGFVVREAYAGDTTCVTPSGRERARRENELADRRRNRSGGPDGLDTCLPGFVWREASPTDFVCVDPAARQRVREENANAANTRGSRACLPGYVWREASPTDHVCVEPAERAQADADNRTYETRARTLGGACDSYAEEAVARYNEMAARNCGFSGALWQGNPAVHREWCAQATRAERDDVAMMRREELRGCALLAAESERPSWEQCAVSAVIANRACLNGDGSPADIAVGRLSSVGCGSNADNARLRARIGFGGRFCLSADGTTDRGCCTYAEQIIPGCLCP